MMASQQTQTQKTKQRFGTKSFILSLLIVLSVGLFAVGCGVKEALKEDPKVLSVATLSMLSASTFDADYYSELPSNITSPASIIMSSDAVSNTYTGALVTGTIHELPDKPGFFPSVQVYVNGALEEFVISKGEETSLSNTNITNDANAHAGQIVYKNSYYYLVDKDGNAVSPLRARLVIDTTPGGSKGALSVVRLVFHPNFSSQSTLYRTVRIKLLPRQNSAYKQSPYSVAQQVQVRKLTFEATSFNSTSINFGYLSYNASRYAFSAWNNRTIQGTSRTYRLEGYFAENRVVEVSRHLLKRADGVAFDFDFQNWTVGQMANTALSTTKNNKTIANYTEFYVDLGNASTNATNINWLAEDSSNPVSAWDNGISSFGYHSAETPTTAITENMLCVRASATTHNKTFFANYARVNNFEMYGRVFNGDEVTETSTHMVGLANVRVHILGNLNQQIVFNGLSLSGTWNDTNHYFVFGSDANPLLSNANGEFSISGLSKDAQVFLTYVGVGNEAPSHPTLITAGVKYQFVGNQFSGNQTADGDRIILVDTRDKENISATGSALTSGSQLVVNVVLSGSPSSSNSVRYEIAQGVTGEVEYFKADGSKCTAAGNHSSHSCVAYTTTTVLVSAMPTNDTMIVGYQLVSASNMQTASLLKIELLSACAISNGSVSGPAPADANAIYFASESQAFWCKTTSYESTSQTNSFEFEGTTITLSANTLSVGGTNLPSNVVVSPVIQDVSSTTVPQMSAETTTVFGTVSSSNTVYLANVSGGSSSIKATVYETEMKDASANTVHVHYSLSSQTYNNGVQEITRLFYTDAVAHTQTLAQANGVWTGTPVWIAQGGSSAIVANGETLIQNGKIVLGRNIRERVSDNIATADLLAFYNSVGAALRDDYYYYVAPINPSLKSNGGNAVSIFVRNEQETTVGNLSGVGVFKATHLTTISRDSTVSNTSYTQAYFVWDDTAKSAFVQQNGSKLYYLRSIATLESGSLVFAGHGLDATYTLNTTAEGTVSTVSIDGEVVLASGATIKNNSTYEAIAGLLGADINEDIFYYVLPLVSADTSGFSDTTYTTVEQFYYAFFADNGNGVDATTLSRDEISNPAVVLGKVFPSSNGFVSYPHLVAGSKDSACYTSNISLSNLLATTFNTTIENAEEGQKPAYTIDQTMASAETEGFLGATYLSGAPYPNPVFKFSVRHRSDQSSITLEIDIDQIFYVEALGTLVQRETSDVVVDFSAFTFRDTETNLAVGSGSYIQKQSTVLTKNGKYVVGLPYASSYGQNQTAIRMLSLPVEDFATYAGDNNIYYTGADPIVLAFCGEDTTGKGKVFHTQIKVNDALLSFNVLSGTWTINGQTITTGVFENQNPIAVLIASLKTATIDLETPAQKTDFVVWQTSSASIENVAFFDIHAYNAETLENNSELVFDSNCSDPCIGLSNLDENDILDFSNNYDNVVIAGLSSFYRVSREEARVAIDTRHFSGLFAGTALPIGVAENSEDPYFYLATDAVAMVAEPTYNVIAHGEGDVTQSVQYRFKEWRVYRRFNSEILVKYENQNAVSNTSSPIMYFVASDPGYYLFLPVYERVYELSVSTITKDGLINEGGNVSLLEISNGASVSVSKSSTHFVQSLSKDYQIVANRRVAYVVDIVDGIPTVFFVSNGQVLDSNGNFVRNLASGETAQSAEVEDNGNTYTATINDTVYKLDSMGRLLAVSSTYVAVDKFGIERAVSISTAQNSVGLMTIQIGSQIGSQTIKVGQLFEKSFYHYTTNSSPEASHTTSGTQSVLDPTSWLLDRHTGVTIVANPKNGYFLDSFLVTVFDEETNTFITTTQNAISSSASYYDQIEVPTNILLLENGEYYSISFTCANGVFSLERTKTQYSAGSYVLFGGRLYRSNVVVSGNLIQSLSDFVPLSGVSDDYIEYFYHQTEVKLFDNQNDAAAWKSNQTNIEVVETLETKDGKFAVHYVDLTNKLSTILSSGVSALSGKQATEIFINPKNNLFYLAQNNQNTSTLVATKVHTLTYAVQIEMRGNTTVVTIGNTEYVVGTDDIAIVHISGDTEEVLANINEKMPTHLKFGNQYYQIQENTNGSLFITRQYLSYQDGVYAREVFDADEGAKIYYTASKQTREKSASASDDLPLALQTPFVDFLVGQIAAVDKTGQNQTISHPAIAPVGASSHWSVEIAGIGFEITPHGSFENGVFVGSFEIQASVSGTTQIFTYQNGQPFTVQILDKTVTITGINHAPASEGMDASLVVATSAESYELSSTILYENNGGFFRKMVAGNIVVSGNTITINSMDNNYFLTAQFSEFYQTMNYVEDTSENALVTVMGMYYFNPQDNTKAQRFVAETLASDQEVAELSLDSSVFSWKDADGNNQYLSNLSGYTHSIASNKVYVVKNGTEIAPNNFDTVASAIESGAKLYLSKTTSGTFYDQVHTGSLVSKDSSTGQINFENGYLLVSSGFATFVDTTSAYLFDALQSGGYSLRDESGNPGYVVPQDFLQNRWLRFSEGTSAIVVVRVRQGGSLSAASLGLTSIGNLTYLVCPTEETVKSSDYTFYVLRIDFNHNAENVYLEDLEHPQHMALVESTLSTRKVYKDQKGSFFFKKQIEIKNEEANGVITQVQTPIYSIALTPAQQAYVAQIANTGEFYFVPSASLAGLQNASWVKSAPTAPFAVSYNTSSTGLRATVSSTEFLERLSVSDGILTSGEHEGKTKIKISTGYPNNYLNLTSVEIFDFNVFATTLEKGDTLGEVVSDLSNGGYLSANSVHWFGSKDFDLYIAGGRYVSGEQLTVVGLNQSGSTTTTIGNNTFNKITMNASGSNANLFALNGKGNSVLGPLSLCVDTLLAISKPQDAIKNEGGKTYRFAGWYQQKKISDVYNDAGLKIGEEWSELTYMGGEDISFVSIANEDTNIIALYKEVQEVSITYAQNTVSFETNYSLDSTGKPWTYKTFAGGSLTTATGWFDFDSALKVSFTPVSGYRLASFTNGENDYLAGSTSALTEKHTFTLLENKEGTLPAGAYTLETKKLSTVVLALNGFDNIAQGAFTVTLKMGNNATAPTLFSTTNLTISGNEPTFAYTTQNTDPIVTDSTNQYFTLNQEGTSANISIVVQVDEGTSLTATVEKTNTSDTNFDGFYLNGVAQNTGTLTFSASNLVEEVKATIEKINSLSVSTKFFNALGGTESSDTMTIEDLSIAYTNGRYIKNADGSYILVDSDTNSTVLTQIGTTYHFKTSALSVVWANSEKVFEIGQKTYAFVGFVLNGNLVTTERSFMFTFDSPNTLEMRFVEVATISVSTSSTGSAFGSIQLSTTQNDLNKIGTGLVSGVVQDGTTTYVVKGAEIKVSATPADDDYVVAKWTLNSTHEINKPTTNTVEGDVVSYNVPQADMCELLFVFKANSSTIQQTLTIDCQFAEGFIIS